MLHYRVFQSKQLQSLCYLFSCFIIFFSLPKMKLRLGFGNIISSRGTSARTQLDGWLALLLPNSSQSAFHFSGCHNQPHPQSPSNSVKLRMCSQALLTSLTTHSCWVWRSVHYFFPLSAELIFIHGFRGAAEQVGDQCKGSPVPESSHPKTWNQTPGF